LAEGLAPAHPATGAVTTGVVRELVAAAANDEALRPHGSGDDAQIPRLGADGPLSGDPDLAPAVDLASGVVVVAVDPGDGLALRAVRELVQSGLHERLPVRHRVVLGPQHVPDVGVELGLALDEVREVRILEALVLQLRQRDVTVGELVTDSPGSGMHHEPHDPSLIDGDLDEVIAGAERPELDEVA